MGSPGCFHSLVRALSDRLILTLAQADYHTYERARQSCRRMVRYLCVARGKKPTQPKKSLRKLFSSMPTSPVAGEALNLHLLQQ